MAASTGHQSSEVDLHIKRGDVFILSLRQLTTERELVDTAGQHAQLRIRTFDKKNASGRVRDVLTADVNGGVGVGEIQVGIRGQDPQSNLTIILPADLTLELPAISPDDSFELRHDLRVWDPNDENGTKTTWLTGRVIVRDW